MTAGERLSQVSVPRGEFQALIICMMALTALAVDIMLPGLPEVGAALEIADVNDRQGIIIYLLGFALGPLVVAGRSVRLVSRKVRIFERGARS